MLGGWAPPDEKEWAEMDPADMSETKLPTRGTPPPGECDPGPSAVSRIWWRAGAAGRPGRVPSLSRDSLAPNSCNSDFMDGRRAPARLKARCPPL